jgi:hypothetical protein
MNTGIGTSQIIFIVVIGAIITLTLVSGWKIFEKAGYKGWLFLIPLVNAVYMLKIIKFSPWWLLMIFPLAMLGETGKLIVSIIGMRLHYDLARIFGKGFFYSILVAFLPILVFGFAFDGSEYQGQSQKLDKFSDEQASDKTETEN